MKKSLLAMMTLALAASGCAGQDKPEADGRKPMQRDAGDFTQAIVDRADKLIREEKAPEAERLHARLAAQAHLPASTQAIHVRSAVERSRAFETFIQDHCASESSERHLLLLLGDPTLLSSSKQADPAAQRSVIVEALVIEDGQVYSALPKALQPLSSSDRLTLSALQSSCEDELDAIAQGLSSPAALLLQAAFDDAQAYAVETAGNYTRLQPKHILVDEDLRLDLVARADVEIVNISKQAGKRCFSAMLVRAAVQGRDGRMLYCITADGRTLHMLLRSGARVFHIADRAGEISQLAQLNPEARRSESS